MNLPATKKAAPGDTLAKSIQRGKLISEKIESLKGMLAKSEKATAATQTFVNTVEANKDLYLKRNLEQSQTYPVDSRPLARETVIESADSERVKAKIEQLIMGLKPESQQNAFDDKLLFNDDEFGPNATTNPFFFPTDKLEDDFSKSIDFSRVQWRRVKEIASDPPTCGFDRLLSAEGHEDPHKSLIVQGLLGDNWFLSAAAAVFHHDYLFKRLTCEHMFSKYRDYGLYVFKFHKDNKAYYVMVDDKLPVVERATGEFVPVFARCLNANLYWISLLEKAYAKLHYRYYALHNGYIEDALYDLTGLNPESVLLDSEHIQANNAQKFLDCIKVLTLSGTCVCASASLTRVQYSEARAEKLIKDIQSCGLIENSWYHVNDIRDQRENEDVPVPVHKLMRVHCPWGLAVAAGRLWKGEFALNDPRWTARLKERFNAFYLEQRNRYGEDVYVQSFDPKILTGSSVMPMDDFVKLFNSLVVLRDYPQWYNGVEYESCWLPSHGHPHVKSTNWMNNPHYIFRISRKSGETTPVSIVLQQKDPRFLYEGKEPNKYLSIGLVLLSMSPVEEDVKFYDAKRTMGFVKPAETRFVQWSASLANGKYCLIPVTKNAGDVGPFFLKLYYACPNGEITLTNPAFKVIMELERTGPKTSSDPLGHTVEMSVEKEEPSGAVGDEGKRPANVLGVQNSMRVMDMTLSAKMVATFIEKGKVGKWTEKVMTPFGLDEILNPPLTQVPTGKVVMPAAANLSPIKAARSKGRTMGTLQREFLGDLRLRLYDPKLDREKTEDRVAVLLGIEEGIARPRKTPEIEAEQNLIAYSDAAENVSDTLDLNYYNLGDKGLIAVLSYIEVQPIKRLLLRGNRLGNEGIIRLCKMIEESHKAKIETLDLGENEFSAPGAEALYATMERMKSLQTLAFDQNQGLTEAAKARLQFICDSKRVATIAANQ